MTRIIAIIIIIVSVLTFFQVDVHKFVQDIPVVNKLWDIGAGAWYNYLKPLGDYLFTSIAGLFK